jgi:hypothetical protein
VVFGFKDEAQRKRWSNLPVGMFKRKQCCRRFSTASYLT